MKTAPYAKQRKGLQGGGTESEDRHEPTLRHSPKTPRQGNRTATGLAMGKW